MSKKRFIVCLESSINGQDADFLKFIELRKLGWWHWLPNTWLLYKSDGNITASDIREAIKSSYPGVNHLIFELSKNGDTWIGFGHTGKIEGTKSMFKWIRENWKS